MAYYYLFYLIRLLYCGRTYQLTPYVLLPTAILSFYMNLMSCIPWNEIKASVIFFFASKVLDFCKINCQFVNNHEQEP
jgi:hypothetical protein